MYYVQVLYTKPCSNMYTFNDKLSLYSDQEYQNEINTFNIQSEIDILQ